MGDLKKRIFSAVVGGPVVILLFLFLPPKLFFLFIGLVLIMAVYEFSLIICANDRYTVMVLVVISFIPMYLGLGTAWTFWLLFSPALYLLLKLIMTGPGVVSLSINRDIGHSIAVILLAQVFLALPLFFLYRLKEVDSHLPLILLLTIWASDTGAYALGKTMGRHKLAPLISPKKTYEGLLGAMAGAVIVTLLFKNRMGMNIFTSIGIGILIGVLGQLGDILESVAKRVCDVKDSSSLIPGHGGILDRIDSFLFTAPFLYLYFSGIKI